MARLIGREMIEKVEVCIAFDIEGDKLITVCV